MKPIVKLTICVIFLQVLFLGTVYMEAKVKLTNAVCESINKTWTTIDLCRLRAISRNKTLLNVEVTINFPVRSMSLNWQMYKRGNGYKPWLGQYTVDFCAFLRKVNHPVIKIFYDMIKDYSTLNHTCPFIGKQIVKDFFCDARDFTIPMPSGDYLLMLTWIYDKRPQLTTNIYFTFHQDFFKD